MRLLVLKLSALGDVVQGLCALGRLLPAAPPGLEVEWVVDRRFASLLAIQPWLSRVHAVEVGGWWRPGEWRAAARAVAGLRGRRYDAVVDLQGRTKSRLIARLARADRRLAYSRREAVHPWRTGAPTPRPGAIHAVDHYTRLLATAMGVAVPAGAPAEPPPPLFPAVPAEAAALDVWLSAAGVARDERLALVIPGGAWPTKLVPVDLLAAAVAPLARRGLRPLVLWGSQGERRLAEAVAAALGDGGGTARPAVVLPRLTLPGLAALCVRAAVTVGGDTGPLYVAAVQGSATVSIFGPTPAGRTAPRGPRHHAIQGTVPCGPCFRRRCPTGRFICLPGVDPARVTAAALAGLGEAAVKGGAVRAP